MQVGIYRNVYSSILGRGENMTEVMSLQPVHGLSLYGRSPIDWQIIFLCL